VTTPSFYDHVYLLSLLEIIRSVPFQPGIGDPTFVGWLTVAAYFGTAALCGLVAVRGRGRARWLWWSLALLLVVLGINKQLDLQSWFTAVGRAISRAQGWYGLRRMLQFWFIVAVAGAFGALLLLAVWILRAEMRRYWPALLGMSGLLGFVLVRAASFHHVDLLINRRVIGVRINWLLELGAIGLVFAAALREQRRK